MYYTYRSLYPTPTHHFTQNILPPPPCVLTTSSYPFGFGSPDRESPSPHHPTCFFFEFDGNLICIWYFLIPSGGQSVHESTAPRMIKVDCTWDDRSHLASFRVSVPPKLAMVILIDIDINAYHQGGTHRYLTWA